MYYNWFRYYDPKIGRYITSDPIGIRGGLNTYVYANANPLRFTDPNGLFIGTGVARILGTLLGRTPEEIAYGGRILDTGIGAAVGDVPGCVDFNGQQIDLSTGRDVLKGIGGASAISLSTSTTIGLYGAGATLGSATATVALPVALAGYGGYEVGSTFNNVYERARGNSLGSDIYDLVHYGRLFNNPTPPRCGCSR